MTISLHNQVVVITGGAVRLGREIALECARAGASVAITYRTSHDEAHQTVREMQRITEEARAQSTLHGADAPRFACFRADVSVRADVEQLARDIQSTLGGATALVNNAAIFRRTPFDAMNEQDFDAHIAINLKGPYLTGKIFGDIFLRQGGGSIVNIADIYGVRPLKNYVPYCVSKAGVVMLTQSLALALAPSVRVNCVCPGTILVPSQTQGENDDETSLLPKIPLGRLGTASEIAQSVAFLIGGPQFISGAVLAVDGAQLLR